MVVKLAIVIVIRFYSDYSRSEFVKSRASVVELDIFTHNFMQNFGQKKVKLFHHITSAPSNPTYEDIHYENYFLNSCEVGVFGTLVRYEP